ncbi:MAG: phosphoadenylyl-sulfate reductase [Planctomycetes bacterium]|nr:phosphoadenylyl-sulfate reductase [Planctomycetota bacterium]
MARITQADLTELNKSFEERTPHELLQWASSIFGKRVAALSAMQMAGSVVCHMISQLKLEIPILFVDTGVNFQETLDTRDRLARDYNLQMITLHPDLTMEEQTRKHGILYLSAEGQKECCEMRKTIPLQKVSGQYDCLVGSLRRAEGGARSRFQILSVDPQMNCVRINPLANFDNEVMDNYIVEHSVIVNPLHSQGFSTISCNRCTTPVMPGEPKRAGRWRHLGPWSVYCGINPTDFDGGTSQAIDLPQDLIDRLLGRETDFSI